jgi:hypothetical protein
MLILAFDLIEQRRSVNAMIALVLVAGSAQPATSILLRHCSLAIRADDAI